MFRAPHQSLCVPTLLYPEIGTLQASVFEDQGDQGTHRLTLSQHVAVFLSATRDPDTTMHLQFLPCAL